jgi:hypothetical protein
MAKITLEFTEDDVMHSCLLAIFILYRELASGGKLNSPLYIDKFDAIDVIILSVPVPMSLFLMIF